MISLIFHSNIKQLIEINETDVSTCQRFGLSLNNSCWEEILNNNFTVDALKCSLHFAQIH